MNTTNFDIEIQTVQIFKCADGTEFTNQTEAVAHNKRLKEAAEYEAKVAEIDFAINSFNNTMGYVKRNAVQKHTIISNFLKWQMSWDGQFVEPQKEVEVEVEVKDEEVVTMSQGYLNSHTGTGTAFDSSEATPFSYEELAEFHAAEAEQDPFYVATEGTFEPDFDTETGEVYEPQGTAPPF